MQKELQKEKNYLKECLSYLDQELSHMDTSMEKSFQEESEFRKYIWQNKGNMDAQELRSEMQQADMDAQLHNQQVAYYRKLYRIKDNPYFGRIDFTDEDGGSVGRLHRYHSFDKKSFIITFTIGEVRLLVCSTKRNWVLLLIVRHRELFLEPLL